MKKSCKTNFKRVMAYLLALSLIFSLGTANLLTPSALSAAWDGSPAETYAGGSGTQGDPYLVSTAAQLRKAAEEINNKGVYYKLTNDIYLNGNETTDWATFDWENATGLNVWFARWGLDTADQFNGNFDGCGYTVYGIYYKESLDKQGGTRCALFPVTGPNAVISNVIISGSFIQSNYSAGSVIGETTSNDAEDKACVSGCYADNTVIVKGYAYAGGIVGVGQRADFNNCGFTGTVSTVTGSNASGIMGNIWSLGTMNNCYAVGYQLSANMDNFWPASNIYSTVEETVANVKPTVLTADQMKGTDAIANMEFDRLDWDFRYDGYPTPCVRANGYASGSGSETDPYIIKTEAQLKYLVTDTDTADKYYKLANNIVVNESLAGNPKLWFNVTGDDAKDVQFKGTLDGDGYVVSGLFFRGFGWGYYGTGIIPRADGATVKNIGLVNSDFAITGGNASNMVGSIIGRGNNVNISGCFADETVSLNSNLGLAGGIIAVMTGASTIENCCFTGKLAGTTTDAFFADGWTDWKNIKFSYTTSPLSTRSDTYYSAVYTTDTASVKVEKNIFEVDPINLVGAKAVQGLPQLDFNSTWRITDGYPTLLKHYQAQRRAAGLWDGSAAASYESGAGTAANPYKIATAEQLRKLVTDTATEGNYYVLTSDIKLNDTAAEGWTTSLLSNNWITLYNDDIKFQGNFNGGGHNISGMLYNASVTTDGHRSGLFPVVGAGAVITNFSVSDSDMSVGCYGGAAAGFIIGMDTDAVFPEFSYIDVRNTVTIKGATVGGVVGGGTIANFDNCCVTAELSVRDVLNDSVFGIAGDLWGVGSGIFYDITNCYTSKYIPYNTNHLLVNQTNYKNVYAVNNASVNVIPSEVNKNALSKLPNLNWKDVWAWDGEGTVPYLKLNESGNYGVYALGDTDCDGTAAKAADLVVMKKYLLGAKNDDGTAVFAYNADVTENGTVDIIDLVRLKKS